jgi:hypothetical protein
MLCSAAAPRSTRSASRPLGTGLTLPPSWCHRCQARAIFPSPPVPPTCPKHRSTAVIDGQQRSVHGSFELEHRSIRSGPRCFPSSRWAELWVGVILPRFCLTDLHRLAPPRISLNGQASRTPSDQVERDFGESPRTAPDESHSAENRKVGGSIPSLPTTSALVSRLAHLASRETVLQIEASLSRRPPSWLAASHNLGSHCAGVPFHRHASELYRSTELDLRAPPEFASLSP